MRCILRQSQAYIVLNRKYRDSRACFLCAAEGYAVTCGVMRRRSAESSSHSRSAALTRTRQRGENMAAQIHEEPENQLDLLLKAGKV